MSDEVKFLPYKEAARLVGAIQEEEDIDRLDKRILTVYSVDDKELCWFDFEEVMGEIGTVSKEDMKEAVHHYILQRIPDWVNDL